MAHQSQPTKSLKRTHTERGSTSSGRFPAKAQEEDEEMQEAVMPHPTAAASKVLLNALLLIEHDKLRYRFFTTMPETLLIYILQDIFPHLAQEGRLEEILIYRATTNVNMVPQPGLSEFVESLNLQTDFKVVLGWEPAFECPAEIDRSKLHYVFQCPTYEPASHIDRGIALQLMPEVAPSQGGHPSLFRERQKDDNQAINCGRPAERQATIPPVLYDEILAKFQDDCVSGKPTFEDKRCSEEMAARLSAFFNSEAARMDVFREILDKHGIVKLDKFGIDSYTPDGRYVLALKNGHDGKVHVVLVEGKSELSATGAEPYLQGALYHLEGIRKLYEQGAGKNCHLPCLMLLHCGPFVTAAGAVATPMPNVQILSPFLPLHFHKSDNIQRLNLYRFIFAVRRATTALNAFYLDPARAHDRPGFFPYPVSFESEEGKHKYTYIKAISPDRLVFRATTKYAAGEGFAPAILAVNFLSAGWTMVVMEDLVDHYMPFQLSDRTDQGVREALQAALKSLDSKDYVHGDLRKENILVRGKSAMDLDNGGLTSRIKFVDFEWSGPEGVVEYPLQLNTRQIQRPVDAVSAGPIRKSHDREMVEYLFHGD
ncbi:hypothetical protein BU17DRAFT_79877 [Hysterangium stoloniferum]|nr:hypothetical protein BU17DRAFT_79877 [Hysterangium stoloniferum]